MVADCGATCAKYLLCLFNFVFFVVGSAVLCIGVWMAVDKTSFIHLTKFGSIEGMEINNEVKAAFRELTEPTVIEQGAYILIAAGAFIFIISFLGYCGAIKESRVLLTAYGLFIIIIALLQITAIVLAVININDAKEKTKQYFTWTIEKYYTTKEQRDAVTLSWDFMMAELKCCGVENYEDFSRATEFQKYIREPGHPNQNQIIPEACCKLKEDKDLKYFEPKDPNCIEVPTVTNSYYTNGCYESVINKALENQHIVIGVSVGILALQILGIIFSFCLCKAIGKDRDYHYKY